MNLKKLSLILLIILIATIGLTKANIMTNTGTENKETYTPLTPKEEVRDHSQTFLTFPEWYLVFSPDEYADLTARDVSNNFTYFGHISQFWSSYYQIYQTTKNDKLFNFEYHTMIMVIGVSTTVEYFIRGLYEFSIGKLSYMISGRVHEDSFTAEYANDYVDFIKTTPWYEYPFYNKFKELWNTSMYGNTFRSVERRYVLSTELLVKALYAGIIKKATKSTFESPKLYTAVLLKNKVEINNKDVIYKQQINDFHLYLIPRYDPFLRYAILLSDNGAEFIEVAGNNSTILVSLIVKADDSKIENIFYEQRILTKKDEKRLLILVPIKELNTFLLTHRYAIEHVFDY